MELSRRAFIGGASCAGAAAILAGLTGCGQKANDGGGASGGDADSSSKNEFEQRQTLAPEVARTLTCEILVAGGGISGLSAAVEAAQKGASVILLEKASDVGGNSNGAEGPFAVESPMQQEAGIELTLYDAILNELEFSNYRTNTQIWTNFLRRSGEDIQWLMENGVKFVDVRTTNDGLMGWHYYDGGGKSAVAAMKATAESLGVTIMTSTPLTGLILDSGICKGAYAADTDGNTIAVDAAAVILATGGTGANTAILSERTGFDCSKATINCSPGDTGDAIEAVSALDAQTRTACIMGDKCVYGFQMFDHISFATTRQPNLWVNGHGERFVNEGIVRENIPCTFNALFLGQDCAYSILDQATVDRYAAGDLPDKITNYFPDQPSELANLKDQIEQSLNSGLGVAFKGDSVAELATAMGIDADVLAKTVKEYNAVCSAGRDTDFYKKAEYLSPVEAGPFYAFRFDPLVVCAIGGIETDDANRVLKTDGTPVPNVFAVGLDGCNLYEETYNMTLSGSCNGYCVYSGRNAADNALVLL